MEKITLSAWAALNGFTPQRASQLVKAGRVIPVPVAALFRYEVDPSATVLQAGKQGWPKGVKRGPKKRRAKKAVIKRKSLFQK